VSAQVPLATAPMGASAGREKRRLRGDIRFLRIYALTVGRVTRYRPPPAVAAESDAPRDVADRIEDHLAGEASRYRAMGWCILALVLWLPALAGFLWSGMYWLPTSVYWWPFTRGNYGLPLFSVYEWFGYLGLAAYFVVTGGLLWTSHDHTRMLGAEYRRLLAADEAGRERLASAIADGAHPRTEFLVGRSPVFAEYHPLLEQEGVA
jgi:hypothetical protein